MLFRSKILFLLWQQQLLQCLTTKALIHLPIEEKVEITSIIEVAEVEKEHLTSLLNSLISINFSKFSLILMELGPKDQSVRYVGRLVTQHLIFTIGWTMLLRESILLPSL